MTQIESVVFDIDGVLWFQNSLHPSANTVVRELRKRHKSIAFLSNDAAATARSRCSELQQHGLDLNHNEVFTSLTIAGNYLKVSGNPKTLFLGSHALLLEEFPQAQIVVSADAEVVLIGDFFNEYQFEKLCFAFSALRGGAKLVALQKNTQWTSSRTPRIDIGFWVAGLEFCATTSAEVLGKPGTFAFTTIFNKLKIHPGRSVMISDSIEHDLVTAKKLGMQTIYLKEYATIDNAGLLDVPDLCLDRLDELVSKIC